MGGGGGDGATWSLDGAWEQRVQMGAGESEDVTIGSKDRRGGSDVHRCRGGGGCSVRQSDREKQKRTDGGRDTTKRAAHAMEGQQRERSWGWSSHQVLPTLGNLSRYT